MSQKIDFAYLLLRSYPERLYCSRPTQSIVLIHFLENCQALMTSLLKWRVKAEWSFWMNMIRNLLYRFEFTLSLTQLELSQKILALQVAPHNRIGFSLSTFCNWNFVKKRKLIFGTLKESCKIFYSLDVWAFYTRNKSIPFTKTPLFKNAKWRICMF